MHDIKNFLFTSRAGLKGKKWLAAPLAIVFPRSQVGFSVVQFLPLSLCHATLRDRERGARTGLASLILPRTSVVSESLINKTFPGIGFKCRNRLNLLRLIVPNLNSLQLISSIKTWLLTRSAR